MNIFKPIFSADQLDDAFATYLQKWFKSYAAEVAQQRGFTRGVFAEPKFWATTAVLTQETIAQVRYPCVLIVNPGLNKPPRRRGDGTYEGDYTVGIMVMSNASGEQGAQRMAKRYGAAVRTAIMQRPSLDADIEILGVEWTDERFNDYIGADQEQVSSAINLFNVTVGGIMHALDGPPIIFPDPLPEPADGDENEEYPDWPTVRDPDSAPPYTPVTVDNEKVSEDLS